MEKTMIGAGADCLYGYVDGQERVAITNTVDQIVAFLAKHPMEDVLITNILDVMEIQTSMGFIFRCPNQTFLQTELLPVLVPVQRGQKEAEEFIPYVFEETKEVAVHMHMYFKVRAGETEEQARQRAHDFISKVTEEEDGVDYQRYETEVREI